MLHYSIWFDTSSHSFLCRCMQPAHTHTQVHGSTHGREDIKKDLHVKQRCAIVCIYCVTLAVFLRNQTCQTVMQSQAASTR